MYPLLLYTFFSELSPPPESGSDRFFEDGLGDPTPGSIESVGRNSVSTQGLFHMGEQEEVHQH